MDKKQPLVTNVDNELQSNIDLYIKAMNKVTSIYDSFLSHEEFMDKTEEFFSELLKEEYPSA